MSSTVGKWQMFWIATALSRWVAIDRRWKRKALCYYYWQCTDYRWRCRHSDNVTITFHSQRDVGEMVDRKKWVDSVADRTTSLQS